MSLNVINPYQTFRDSTGAVRADGIITFYDNRTTDLASIFSDEALSVSQSNPYTLDASGRVTGDVKYSGLLTLKIQNADLSDIFTLDDVATSEEAALLRNDLASTSDATKGDVLVGHPNKVYSTEFLQTVSDINNGVPISIMRFITTANGEHGKVRDRTTTTDHTTDFNDAITELNAVGGGKIIIPTGDYNVESLVPKTGVIIQGDSIGKYSPNQSNGARLVALGDGGYIFNQTSGVVYDFTVDGLLLEGAGVSVAGGGIKGVDLSRGHYLNLSFNGFSDEAIVIDAGTVSQFRNIFAQNCLLDTTRSAKSGVIDITANDCMFDTMEITASLIAESDSNLYLCAFNIAGSNHFAVNLIGEISDIGFYITCSNSRFANCRADLNQGHGWELVGAGSNGFVNCTGHRNSQDTDDTYSQWEIDSASGANRFTGCNGSALAVDAKKGKYGFNDALNSDSSKNTYVNCVAAENITKNFNMISFAGSAVSFPTGGPPKAFTAADATPSVDQYCFFKTADTTTYTDFDTHVPGQEIKIIAFHTATLTNGTNIKTNTGANKTMVVNKIYTLRDVNGVWYEVE